MTGSSQSIVLAAGGTGGHMFPAEALAKVLKQRGHTLVWITDERGAARNGLLSELQTHTISARGLAGFGAIGRLTGALSLGVGVFQARRILKDLNPAAVIGFGGYAAAPTMMAATHLKLRTAIHEQNAVVGMANRLFAKRVDQLCTSFEKTRLVPEGVSPVLTGMPVRASFGAVRAKPYTASEDRAPIRIVVLGGSQGAAVFSHLVPCAIKRLPEELRKRITVDQQCRSEIIDQTRLAYSNSGVQARLQPFFEDVPDLVGGAHLVIARSGASTVSEVSYTGRPAIYVPYPYAADDHQTDNAQALVSSGAGWCGQQDALTPDSLAVHLEQLLTDPSALTKAAANAKQFSITDAANRLADVVDGLVQGSNGHSVQARGAA
ncbi:MAG: undecaprenyldiphospho-muramoylpentapeptide beta-N-acetylglucosaminyltransferase [Rhodospirillaceae bacterium]|jgi:UDP-N-acetylglucosamine--N-acetylmuramyl-(pentapeptide) pyrophosphoryl-undecaprenol N-acetylglucosamine transferase|nr:undecaprenyldiphospho-muramoylpentapeptide beta-N-acetylglucosaminyltransferase [Rhodospirillaceae bacterium]MBT6091086.1 undecaprenyldiphospho-muramoylpentapeptide beta-N-acetylglucosaminyltransferase [Rhodospirillaceae bacterium]MBT6961314.1 undecaprenyldiphospho-muramoylpentapeptide beta-N-acetylglucosaminyltransferase [Rhodospirillaceae bacterium]MBT7450969.1 undecaprenyldiphospho-muramoylpentapeptide beta-N-acetylglucosaminyltransferase [Rhodospirillaceae bacterium]